MANGQQNVIPKVLSQNVCEMFELLMVCVHSPIEFFFGCIARGFPQNGFVPYGIGQKAFRPCICDDRSMWRDNSHRRSFGPSTPRTQGVDDKLEYPFSESD